MNPEDFLPSAISTDAFIMLMVAGSTFLTVLAVWNGLIARDPMRGRVKNLVAQRDAMKQGLTAPRRRNNNSIQAMGFMRSVTTKLNLMRSQQTEEIELKLSQAGWRGKDALVVYLFFKVCLPVVLGAATAGLMYLTKIYDGPAMMRLTLTMTAIVAGVFAPEIYVRNVISKRRKALQKGLPDALDLLVICTEAGLGLDAALNRVSGEIAPNSPELADELTLTALELGFLPERKKALDNLNARTDLAAIRGVVNTLVQTEKYGTPLASSLRVLGAEFREERMLKAEEKAAKLPATLTVPMILFILPTLFIVLLGPAGINAMDALKGMN